MLLHKLNVFKRFASVLLLCLGMFVGFTECIFFPRGGSIGILAAVATPLDLPNRNVYVAFNFEANYGLPSNDSYNEWIDRWNLDKYFLGIGSNVTAINGRRTQHNAPLLYTRGSFYRSVAGYLEHFGMNGTACLLRTICEISATSVDENNGLLGSIFKILFKPTTSAAEAAAEIHGTHYEAEWCGSTAGNCNSYVKWCPVAPLHFITKWL